MKRGESFFRLLFLLAAVYNVLWGIFVIAFPNFFFDFFEIPYPKYPMFFGGIGFFVAVYGYGYWVVSQNLWAYPQLVIVGLIGKALGPIGWLYYVSAGQLPAKTLLTNVFNDFIWIPFFVAYLIWFKRNGGVFLTRRK